MAGLFNSIKKEMNLAAESLSREVDTASRYVNNKWDEHKQSPLLDHFRTNNVVQLLSVTSGRALQIVQASTGQLTVDGLGHEGPNTQNAHWTVMNEGNNTVRLYNYSNFLAVKDGMLLVVPYPSAAQSGVETRFRLHQINATHICLESAQEIGRHVGILANGQIKSPVATGREMDSHFGVRLIHNAYPPPARQQTTVIHTPAPSAPTRPVVVGKGGSTTVIHQAPQQPGQTQVVVGQGATIVHHGPSGSATGGNVTVIKK